MEGKRNTSCMNTTVKASTPEFSGVGKGVKCARGSHMLLNIALLSRENISTSCSPKDCCIWTHALFDKVSSDLE